MSDLQLALLALAGAIVLAVVVYNKWQERRHRREAEALFQGAQADVLSRPEPELPHSAAVLPDDEGDVEATKVSPVGTVPEAGRREPVLGPLTDATGDAEAAIEAAGAAPDEEPTSTVPGVDAGTVPASTVELPPHSEAGAAAAEKATLPAGWADPVADAIVRLDFASPVTRAMLVERIAGWAQRLRRPLRALSYVGTQWLPLASDDQATGVLALAVQLADRRGAIAENEVDTFLVGVQGLARKFPGQADLPTKAELLSHARALDEFCATVDVQLGVGLMAAGGTSFAGTKLRGLAEAAGLTLHEDGRFHMLDDADRLLFTIGNAAGEPLTMDGLRAQSLAGLLLMLDVPRVAEGTQVFDRLLVVARQLAQGLGGRLVDGQGRPLGDAMIQGIRAKIAEVQTRMTANQIPPGSLRALRLFS